MLREFLCATSFTTWGTKTMPGLWSWVEKRNLDQPIKFLPQGANLRIWGRVFLPKSLKYLLFRASQRFCVWTNPVSIHFLKVIGSMFRSGKFGTEFCRTTRHI